MRQKFKSRKAVAESISLRAALILMVLVRLVAPIYAHPVPFSYLDLRLGQSQGQLEGYLVAHITYLARELNVTPAESLLDPVTLDSKKEAVLSLLRPHILLTADGQALDLKLERVEPLPDRQAVALHLRLATKALPAALGIQCALFTSEPEHHAFLNIYEEGLLARQEIFDKDHTALDYYTGSRQIALAVVKKFIPLGVYHIFTGPDHVLFIVGLLLMGGTFTRLPTIVTALPIPPTVTP